MQPRHLLPATVALILPVCLLWELPVAKGYIHAVSDHNTSMEFSDLPAIFGYPLPQEGLMGLLVEARPANACLPLQAPPSNSSVFIALVRRFNCSFDIKVYHAQQAGFLGVIVHNVGSDDLLNMVWEDDQLRRHITVPSVFTGETAATYLRSLFTYERGGHVILIPEYIFPLGYYLIPFTGVVGVVIAVMCTILIVRCIQHRKRMQKDRLSKEQLKKIPLHKYKKGLGEELPCFKASALEAGVERGVPHPGLEEAGSECRGSPISPNRRLPLGPQDFERASACLEELLRPSQQPGLHGASRKAQSAPPSPGAPSTWRKAQPPPPLRLIWIANKPCPRRGKTPVDPSQRNPRGHVLRGLETLARVGREPPPSPATGSLAGRGRWGAVLAEGAGAGLRCCCCSTPNPSASPHFSPERRRRERPARSLHGQARQREGCAPLPSTG